MKYVDLQRRLKQYQIAGLIEVKLNSPLPVLAAEYRRCLKLGLSQNDLERLALIKNRQRLDLISCIEIYTKPEQFLLRIIKAKAYDLGKVDNLAELKLAFPIFKHKQYDFRTKASWSQCVSLIDNLTKNSQEFEKFKFDVQKFITAIKKQQYYQFTGETAVEEAYNDLSNYISWWKGAQWEYTLANQASTLDLLKRAWLEQYLAQNDLGEMLKYSSID
ncbi:hypothetical protein IQ255_00640 [Pleurocapsales cyanobacterium LEGE 10410]|nr:hypothetical protein [Pleurocapsales cyanobacterium LEGE 10410]